MLKGRERGTVEAIYNGTIQGLVVEVEVAMTETTVREATAAGAGSTRRKNGGEKGQGVSMMRVGEVAK